MRTSVYFRWLATPRKEPQRLSWVLALLSLPLGRQRICPKQEERLMELCSGSSDGKLLSSSQWGARYLPPAASQAASRVPHSVKLWVVQLWRCRSLKSLTPKAGGRRTSAILWRPYSILAGGWGWSSSAGGRLRVQAGIWTVNRREQVGTPRGTAWHS